MWHLYLPRSVHGVRVSRSAGVSPAVLWLMLNLASWNGAGGPVVVLGTETPLAVLQPRC